ncbi:MAG: HmuY family protein, partial [Gemmatimonadetes bacterium]|nr:HmuY family protein [Gemmatimonadota bacterium]
LVVDTVTIDATAPAQWRFFGFTRGLLTPPDTAGWDLAVRRFHLIVAEGGGVVRVDTVAFDGLREAPATGYVPTTFGRDSTNPVLARWYRYSTVSHLLRPKPLTYVIRARDGRYAKLEFLSYYCPGPQPGCVTFRYLYGSAGDRRLR